MSAIVVMSFVSLIPQISDANGIAPTRQLNMSKPKSVSKVPQVESEKICIASAIVSPWQTLAQQSVKPRKFGFDCGMTTILAAAYASRGTIFDQPAKFWNWLTR